MDRETGLGGGVRLLKSVLRRERHHYSAGEERPLPGYAASLAAFGAYAAGWTALVRRSGRPLPSRPDPRDLVLISAATFRLSRLLSKGSVTSPLRAPFTEFEGPAGPAELSEKSRGGRRKEAVGELVTCPFCLSVWVVTTLTAAQLIWPRATRTATGALTALAAADTMQLAYSTLVGKATKA
ncbi:DUF1360 domain-containing protein [Streptomyces sp. NPDC003016]